MSAPPEKSPPPYYPPPPRKSGLSTVWIVLGVCGGLVLLCCCTPFLALPAIQATRERVSREVCQNHLKQIGLAMQLYVDAHREFPPAYIADAEGRALLSWRVLLLPYFEQTYLYDQFDREKAWDSPENLAASETPVDVYRCTSTRPKPRESLTDYVMVTGPDALFNGAERRVPDHLVDGPSNTIMIIESVGLGIHWAEPRDLTLDEVVAGGIGHGNHAGAGSCHAGGMFVLMCDNSVHFVADSTDSDSLRALLTPNGGEPVKLP